MNELKLSQDIYNFKGNKIETLDRYYRNVESQ